MNKDIMRALGFGRQVDAVDAGICPFCHVPIIPNEFRDALSLKEFRISGLCQKCQDETFGNAAEAYYTKDFTE